jgi:hypothetical protein
MFYFLALIFCSTGALCISYNPLDTQLFISGSLLMLMSIWYVYEGNKLRKEAKELKEKRGRPKS